MAWQIEDNTYNDIRERSLDQWLNQMANHEDIEVRGGVKLAKDYIEHLKKENSRLESEIDLRNEYLKKMKNKWVNMETYKEYIYNYFFKINNNSRSTKKKWGNSLIIICLL